MIISPEETEFNLLSLLAIFGMLGFRFSEIWLVEQRRQNLIFSHLVAMGFCLLLLQGLFLASS